MNKRLLIDDLILILCFEYVKQNYSNNSKLYNEFIDTLLNTATTCLDGKNNKFKARDYFYFKKCLLFSNVWLCKDNNDILLYKHMVKRVDVALIKQQEFMFEHAKKENEQNNSGDTNNNDSVSEMKIDDNKNDDNNNEESNGWHKILTFKPYNNEKYAKTLRQDGILNGITAEVSFEELYLMQLKLGDNDSWNVFSSQTNGVYLTQMLTLANYVNGQYQNDMKDIFYNIICNENDCTFMPAPVKTQHRCIVKSQTDYSFEKYPSVANILDYNRCSCTFKNPDVMYNALNKLIECINNGNGKCVKGMSVLLVEM